VLAGIAEAGGGLLLALGLLTPLACTAIAIVMLNAIFTVTLKRAFLLGSELELMYLVTVIALAAIGPGRFSLDARSAGTTTSRASGGASLRSVSRPSFRSRRSRSSTASRRRRLPPPRSRYDVRGASGRHLMTDR
jgi:hypothetical protein